MVRPVETIRREIDSLTEATVALGAEFRRLYAGYLESLGMTAKREVVMATYHLCTQVYPENFLALSVAQREALQREVRRLGLSCQTQMGQLLEAPAQTMGTTTDPLAQSSRLSLPEGFQATLRFLPGEVSENGSSSPGLDEQREEASTNPSPALDQPDPDQPETKAGEEPTANSDHPGDDPLRQSARLEAQGDDDEVPLPSLLKSMVMAALAEEMAETFGEPLFTGDDMTPTRLAKQHIFLEQQIRRLLQQISKQVNQKLQAAQVIPNLPEAVLDAASESEMGPIRGRAVPNVLSVLVAISSSMEGFMEEEEGIDPSNLDDPSEDDPDDDEDDEDDEDNDGPRERMMTHLATVNLRLADLEFGDVQVSMARSKLRKALGYLRKLGKQYQKVQRELAIAEAEQAWRAVWYDES